MARSKKRRKPAARSAVTPDFMARALELARLGLPTSQPNPSVGCVIVKNGRIVGEGFHAKAGGPHAEVVAFKQAGTKARGADMYVTLEPCSHFGRTPPCADAVVAAGVRKVVAALEDPNPKVSGSGLAKLREAGVKVELGPGRDAAAQVHRGFISRMTRGRPWVTLKLAASLDGRIALANGESRWITSEASRADVHRLRAEAGAVLTGAGTVLADNPALTVRAMRVKRQPDRIVLDSGLRLPAERKVWADGARRIVMAVRPPKDHIEALRARGVEVALSAPQPDGRLDLGAALATLGRMEINEVLVECGPTLAGALLGGRHVDELVVYLAPSLLGDGAQPLAQLPALDRLGDRLQFSIVDTARIGPDLRLTLRPA